MVDVNLVKQLTVIDRDRYSMTLDFELANGDVVLDTKQLVITGDMYEADDLTQHIVYNKLKPELDYWKLSKNADARKVQQLAKVNDEIKKLDVKTKTAVTPPAAIVAITKMSLLDRIKKLLRIG